MTSADGLVPAPVWSRFAARAIDFAAAFVILMPLTVICIILVAITGLGVSDDAEVVEALGVAQVAAFALAFVGWVVLETWGTTRGWGTPGKRMVGLRMSGRDGAAPGARKSTVRTGALLAPVVVVAVLLATPWFSDGGGAFLFLCGYHLVSWVVCGRGSSFQDRVARTLVVRRAGSPSVRAPVAAMSESVAGSQEGLS